MKLLAWIYLELFRLFCVAVSALLTAVPVSIAYQTVLLPRWNFPGFNTRDIFAIIFIIYLFIVNAKEIQRLLEQDKRNGNNNNQSYAPESRTTQPGQKESNEKVPFGFGHVSFYVKSGTERENAIEKYDRDSAKYDTRPKP